MKLINLLLISLIVCFSCSTVPENSEKTSYSDFEVRIDTIQVDAGNEILMAGAEIRNPGISRDNKWLYNWDQKNYALEIVNLEEYKLEKKIYFEKEGPNGIGPNNFYRVDPFPGNLFGFEDYESYRIYDLNGKLEKKIVLDNEEWINNNLAEPESFNLHSVNDDGTVLAGMYFDFDNFKPLMYLLDLENEEVSNINLPEYEKLKNYQIFLKNNDLIYAAYAKDVFIQFLEDSIFISNNAFNDVYSFHLTSETLNYKSYNFSIIQNNEQKLYKNETASEEEFNQIVKEMRGGVEFSQFFYDELKERYYRFASEVINMNEEEPRRKIFVAVFDKGLCLIGEKEVMTFKSEVTPMFIKDGVVHFYLNMEDELGFIRVNVN